MSLYKDLLSKGKEAIEAIQLPFKVEKEKKHLEMKILELKQTMATDALTVQEQKSACPVNWDKLIEAIDAEAMNKRKLKQLEDLENELFLLIIEM
jgi:hypothetical protein